MAGSEAHHNSITLIAAEISAGDMDAAKKLIRQWSAFDANGASGQTIDIFKLYGDNPWPRVSAKWAAIILSKAKAAHADWQQRTGTISMFDEAEVTTKKPGRAPKRRSREYVHNIDHSKRMPEVEDNGSDLPF